jgi:hypothetical protein
MHVGLQPIAVHLDLKCRDGHAAFFCEHLAVRRRNGRVDLLEQCVVQQRDVVPQGLIPNRLSSSPHGVAGTPNIWRTSK